MNERFTIDGSRELEQHLARICAEVREGIRALIPAEKLEAIYLGGGYGRGEGGVLKTSKGDRPYNDMEFYICVTGNPRLNERAFGHPLHELAEELSKHAEVEVEFKISALAKLKKSKPSMFLYDLAMGHKVLWGNSEAIQNPQFQDPSLIPLHEATRLLMNRCSGLLFAEEKLTHVPFNEEDADFVGRNHAKAQLAFGDIVLTVLGEYHWSCLERKKRLQSSVGNSLLSEFPVSLSKLICHHSIGVEFKLHPKKSFGTAAEFLALQAELRELGRNLWLWLESRRLHKRFGSIGDYSFSQTNKCPETNPIKNRLVNLKRFGVLGALGMNGSRYPRERLLHSLPLLLWEPSICSNPDSLRRVQEELNTVSTDFGRLVEAYSALWRNFN